MSKKLELGKYEFFPYEFEHENETPEETCEKLKKLAGKFSRKDEKINDEQAKQRNQNVASTCDWFV